MTRTLGVALVVLCALAAPAHARNTDLVLGVQDAVESDMGKARLLSVPFYFAGQTHPPIAESIAEWRSKRATRGVFRTDESSCRVAFLSALMQLQQRAQQQGADAIVEIESITRDRPLSSPTEYRCVAGATVVHVGLKGRLVKLGK